MALGDRADLPVLGALVDHRAVAGRTAALDEGALVDGLAVDHQPALVVAALDGVAGDADDALHQVATGGVEPDLGHGLRDGVGRAGRVGRVEPAARVLEDHYVAALGTLVAPEGRLLHP